MSDRQLDAVLKAVWEAASDTERRMNAGQSFLYCVERLEDLVHIAKRAAAELTGSLESDHG